MNFSFSLYLKKCPSAFSAAGRSHTGHLTSTQPDPTGNRRRSTRPVSISVVHQHLLSASACWPLHAQVRVRKRFRLSLRLYIVVMQ